MIRSRFNLANAAGSPSRGALVGLLLLAASGAAQASPASPLPVVENRGQLPDEVLFVAEGAGATVFFTADGVVLDVRRRDGGGTVVRVPVTGVNVRGDGALPTRFSAFHGREATRWLGGIPSWSTVVYDLPGTGARLVWQLDAGGLRYRLDGDVDDGFAPVLEGDDAGAVATVPTSDRSGLLSWRRTPPAAGRDLASGLLWSTFLGHDATDKGLSVALTADGSIIAAGRSRSAEFPTTEGSYSNSNEGLNDAFVVKLTADGSSMVWGTLIGSSGEDVCMCVVVAPGGDIVLTGLTSEPDWPTTSGAYDETGNGQRDVFVVRLAPTGDALIWSTYLGGAGNDVGNRMFLDPAGCPVITGDTSSPDWPTTPGAHDGFPGGGWDAFLARLSADGSTLEASTVLGGSGDDVGRDLERRDDGTVVMVGGTRSPGFPTTPGAYATSHAGGEDGYVACLDPADGSLIWSTLLGGAEDDDIMRLALDDEGAPVVTGGTYSSDFPTTMGAFDRSHNGLDDCFVTSLAADGGSLIWSSLLGGSEADRGYEVILGPAAEVTVMGYTHSTDLPVTPAAFDPSANGSYDVFVHRLSAHGGNLLAGSYFGGEGRDEMYTGIVTDSGALLLTGMTHSPDLPTTPGAFQTGYGGDADAYIALVDPRAWYPLAADPATPAAPTAVARPNPFNPRVVIAYDLPRSGPATVRIYDPRGRLVRTLVDGDRPAGDGEAVWDGRDRDGKELASGTYLYEVRSAGREVRGKLALVR